MRTHTKPKRVSFANKAHTVDSGGVTQLQKNCSATTRLAVAREEQLARISLGRAASKQWSGGSLSGSRPSARMTFTCLYVSRLGQFICIYISLLPAFVLNVYNVVGAALQMDRLFLGM